jgi:murein DD-endopeptidase MepM/ murein hydrolase activator NlpD
MDFQNSPENQHIETRKKPHFGFFMLFAISVSLNFYFLLFGGKNTVEIADTISQKKVSFNLVESQLGGLEPEPIIMPEKGVPKTPVIQPVAFSMSEDINLGNKSVQSLEFKVRNSLNYTVCKILSRKDGCAALSAHLGRLMSWFFDVNRDIRKDDSVKVIYQKMEGPEQFKILKLSYKSQRFGETFVANFFDGLSQSGYFDLEGNDIAQRIVEAQSPIRNYTEVTSLPGDFRKGVAGHSGTDFKAPVGTPVYSGFEGKVTRANWNTRANGSCVEIDHPKQGIKTLYLHLSRVLVKRGQAIKAGQQVAESGNTGRTFTPHLHYEIQHRKNKGRIYNPFKSKYHKHYTRKITASHIEQFQKTVKHYDSLLKQG